MLFYGVSWRKIGIEMTFNHHVLSDYHDAGVFDLADDLLAEQSDKLFLPSMWIVPKNT